MSGSSHDAALLAPPPGTGLVFDHGFRRHDPGPGHPESPDRYLALSEAFRKSRILESAVRIPPRMASEDDIHLAHTRPYWKTVLHDVARKAQRLSTGDTHLGAHSLDTALLAAGGALSAVDAVMQGRVRNAFAAVRPPGHHANASRGMGFCVFNTAAIAARYARKVFGADRVLIVDFDVHHGNGTQEIFYSDPSVLFFSTHQWPWYPGTGAADETGEGAGAGYTINCPFPAGSGHAEVLGAFRKKLLPAALDFKPALVLVSAGFDSRRGDPLGRFTLRDSDFADMTSILMEIASASASGRLVSILEGGYNLNGLAKAALAHFEALRG
ncbi:MAG: histone deacetylase [Candidatus Solibacter sp.]|nr:histone deacetylase [Candidatus Solibacter sp.]